LPPECHYLKAKSRFAISRHITTRIAVAEVAAMSMLPSVAVAIAIAIADVVVAVIAFQFPFPLPSSRRNTTITPLFIFYS